MALVNGTNYDHIDLQAAAGGDVTRHKLQDTDGRAMFAPTEDSTTASAPHKAGSCFILNGTLYRAIKDIAVGDTITVTAAARNATPVTVGGNMDDVKKAIAQNCGNGTVELTAFSEFERGLITANGNNNTSSSDYRIRSVGYITTTYRWVLNVAVGYQLMIFTYTVNQGVYTKESASSWLSGGPHFVEQGKIIRIQIRKKADDADEDTDTPADVEKFLAAVRVNSYLLNEVEEYSLKNLSETLTFTVDDFETGNLSNTTGRQTDATNRTRTKNAMLAYKGLTILSAVNFNVFEYDIRTGVFITEGHTTDWKHTYTVSRNCLIKMAFGDSPLSDILAGLKTVTPMLQIDTGGLPLSDLSSVLLGNQLQSQTVRSVAHRGRYGYGLGMMCGASAVIAARRYGYLTVENDVRTFAAVDGQGQRILVDPEDPTKGYVQDQTDFVMWHNDSLSLIGVEGGVEDYSLADLKALDFGSVYGFPGEKILTFTEWMKLCKKLGLHAFIDFKVAGDNFTDTMAQNLVNIVKKTGMINHVTYLNNFDKIRTYHPGAPLVTLSSPTTQSITTFAPYLEDGPFSFGGPAENVTAENAAMALQAGFGMGCYYTSGDYEPMTDKATVFAEITRLVECGVDYITLDYFRVEDAFNEEYGLT